MLAQRCRRWTSIEPRQGQRLWSAGNTHILVTVTANKKLWFNINISAKLKTFHLHLSSCLVPDSLISRICAMSILPPSSLANSDNPDKLTWVWPSTLQTVNRWHHNEYSCCSHPSFSYRSSAHLLSRSDQWSYCQTGCGKMKTLQRNTA